MLASGSGRVTSLSNENPELFPTLWHWPRGIPWGEEAAQELARAKVRRRHALVRGQRMCQVLE